MHLLEEVHQRKQGFYQPQGKVSSKEKLFYFKSNTEHEVELFGSIAQKGHCFFKTH